MRHDGMRVQCTMYIMHIHHYIQYIYIYIYKQRMNMHYISSFSSNVIFFIMHIYLWVFIKSIYFIITSTVIKSVACLSIYLYSYMYSQTHSPIYLVFPYMPNSPCIYIYLAISLSRHLHLSPLISSISVSN